MSGSQIDALGEFIADQVAGMTVDELLNRKNGALRGVVVVLIGKADIVRVNTSADESIDPDKMAAYMNFATGVAVEAVRERDEE